VKDWRAVVPSSPEQQIAPERIRGAQEAVARGNALPHDIGSAGILILGLLAIVYTLYFGKETLLPIALALVLKLLLQPAMGSVSTSASWRIPVVMGYAAARFRGMKRMRCPASRSTAVRHRSERTAQAIAGSAAVTAASSSTSAAPASSTEPNTRVTSLLSWCSGGFATSSAYGIWPKRS
jgi:hypothetical protein